MQRLFLILYTVFIHHSPFLILHSAQAAQALVPETGQTASYGVRDDGDLRPGVAWPDPRFTDNGNGTITDNLTGLIWLQNANCTDTVGGITKAGGSLSWDNALTWCNNLSSGKCGLSDGSSAGQWRLPNVVELKSLIDLQRVHPGLPSGHPFGSVVAWVYWSSSTHATYKNYAWDVDMDSGFVSKRIKGSRDYVWPVRIGTSGPLNYSISGNTSVAGATVTLSGAANATTTSAADGTYSFSSLSAGSYTVTPTLAGYTFTPPSQTVTVTNQNATVPAFTATDIAPPVINSVTLPSSPITCIIPVTIDATDNAGIAGYYLSENDATPAIGDPGWSATLPTNFTFAGLGTRTLYVWVKDAAGNLSARSSASVTIVGVAKIGAVEYCSLNAAYNAASSGDTIWTLDALLNESLTVNKLLKLIGSYNLTYSGRTGNPTALQGILTIGTGSLNVDGLAVR